MKLLSTTTENQINPNYIKIKLDDKEPVLLSSLSEGLIAEDLKLNPEESITMSIRIWLSIDTPNTEIGKTFSAKIVTDGVGSEYIPPKLGTSYIESLLVNNPETMNNEDPDGNVRYMGKNPNNYVSFNNELWRIIGVFNVKSSEDGQVEKRLKIIKEESIGDYYWNNWEYIYENDWSIAFLRDYLNGYYYNSLTTEAKGMIEDAYWNLGGFSSFDTTPNQSYNYERGTDVYESNSTYWIGKIGLMYPSDYGYATSDNFLDDSCYNVSLYNYYDYGCSNNDFLYDGSAEWTITSKSDNNEEVFYVSVNSEFYSAYNEVSVRPTLYLDSTVQIIDGTGTSENPYILDIENSIQPNIKNAAKYIDSLLPSNPETMNNDDPDGNIRYMGANPNNYVSFNDELWRIIGVFDVKSFENGPEEKRLKIIRDELIGYRAWNEVSDDVWNNSSLAEYLNTEYYSSLTVKAKQLIGYGYWNLGGPPSNTSTSEGISKYFYEYEREDTIEEGTITSREFYFTGKIGLMYPSDYGYATSGGTTINRNSCLEKRLVDWAISFKECASNDYLNNTWTMTWDDKYLPMYNSVFAVLESEFTYARVTNPVAVRPTVYLSSLVQITGGDGTQSNPYTLQI